MPDPDPDAARGPVPFRPATPLVIGLMGGIAAGKSTVAAAFARRGLRHIDADQHARAATARPEVLAALVAAFGPSIRAADGTLDRPRLAALAFADAAARQRLEAITHPAIRAAILADLAAARAAGQSVLLDAPLLLEGGLIELCDVTVFVQASDATRERRARSRGWPAGELERRQAAQAPLAAKLAAADHVIDNDGTVDATEAQVDALLQRLLAAPRCPPPA